MGERVVAWRGAVVGIAGLSLLLPALLARSPVRAQDPEADTGPGFGQAVAQLIRVDPRAAGLSAGVEIGAAKASHQNRSSLATARVLDVGLTGVILAAEPCDGTGEPSWPAEDQPQAIRADSDDTPSVESHDGLFERRATAIPDPLAHAEVVSQPLRVPGLITIGAARSFADSGVAEDGVREARSVVEIDAIDLLDGLVRLSTLRWESRHRSGADDVSTGSFTIDAASIGGVPVPGDAATALLGAVDDVLRPLGVRLLLPEVHERGGILFVDPLTIEIEPSAQRDALLGELLRALQPVREPLLDALFALACDFAGLVTVVDLVVGSISGAGRVSVELGGTEATTEAIPPPAVAASAPSTTAPTPPADGVPVPSPRRPSAAPVASAPAPPAGVASLPPATPTADGGSDDTGRDLAAVVGMGTIAFGLVLAESDRRTMRRAQRPAVEEPA